MKMTPHIFFDLDETLIHSNDIASSHSVAIVVRDFIFHVNLRPLCRKMLADTRALVPVRLITSAIRDYALQINDTLQLGFKEDEILAREDYAYYGKDHPRTFYPQGILIDNYPITNEWSITKISYLGIPDCRYIQISDYLGWNPEPKFDLEWDLIFQKIKVLLIDN